MVREWKKYKDLSWREKKALAESGIHFNNGDVVLIEYEVERPVEKQER